MYVTCNVFREVKLEDSYFNRDVEKAVVTASKAVYKAKTEPGLLVAHQVGNTYTSSVYGSLASCIAG